MLSPNFFTGKTFICHWPAWNLNSWQEYLIYMFPIVTWLKGGQMIVCLGEEWLSISKIVGSSKFKYVIPFNIFKHIATIAKYPFLAICYFSNTATEFPCISRVSVALTLLTVLCSSHKKGFFTVLLSPTSQAWHAKTYNIINSIAGLISMSCLAVDVIDCLLFGKKDTNTSVFIVITNPKYLVTWIVANDHTRGCPSLSHLLETT